eukprot:5576477-Prymnesium_polylepis.3
MPHKKPPMWMAEGTMLWPARSCCGVALTIETTAMNSEPANSQMNRFRPSSSSSHDSKLVGGRLRHTGRRGSQKGNWLTKSTSDESSMQPKKTRPCGESKDAATNEMVPRRAKPRGSRPQPVRSMSSRSPSAQPRTCSRSAWSVRKTVGRIARAASEKAVITQTAEKRWLKAVIMLGVSMPSWDCWRSNADMNPGTRAQAEQEEGSARRA